MNLVYVLRLNWDFSISELKFEIVFFFKIFSDWMFFFQKILKLNWIQMFEFCSKFWVLQKTNRIWWLSIETREQNDVRIWLRNCHLIAVFCDPKCLHASSYRFHFDVIFVRHFIFKIWRRILNNRFVISFSKFIKLKTISKFK